LSSTALPTLPRAAGNESVKDRAWAMRVPQHRTMALIVLAISTAYVGWYLFRGWIPFDDGAMAHSAERLMNGQLPHRDFDDIYTGGLAFLDAAAFWLFGMALPSLRLPLFAVFMAWVPAVYYIASRFVRQYAAAAVTLLAVVWSLPNYTAAMPSWYNLFFATLGVAALFRHIETGRARWLFAAGVAGSLSILVKIVGLYYVAGALLFLVYRAHVVASANISEQRSRGRGYVLTISATLLLFLALLLRVLLPQLRVPEALQFFLPALLVVVLLWRQEWTIPAGASGARFLVLGRLLLPFVAGLLVPIALFLIPYLRSGSVDTLVRGVFLLPLRRFGFAVMKVLPLWTMFACVPFVVVSFLLFRFHERADRWLRAALAIAAVVILVLTIKTYLFNRWVWYGVRDLTPILVVIGAAVLWRLRAANREESIRQQQLMVMLSATALCTLIQFPYFATNYYCYFAPIVILTIAALYSYLKPAPRAVPAIVVGFYMLFAVVNVNNTSVFWMGRAYHPYGPMRRLAVPRGGIDVTPDQAEIFEILVPMLQKRARGGYTWASRDCPEVYFLTGLKNPTRTLFDFFDDTTNYSARTLRALDDHGVTAIVMNRWPAFSPQFTVELVDSLAKRYPYSTNIGPYHVRWKS